MIAFRTIARSIRFQQHPELTACWVWIGPINNRGSAIACYEGEQHSARRAVYQRYRGTPPEHSLQTHCNVKLCVNPSHVVTP